MVNEQILESMFRELAHITEMERELDELTSYYERYRFLSKDLQERLDRLKRVKQFLLSPQALPVWELMELFLYVKLEAKVQSIQDFLKKVGRRGVSRQAIASALKIHGDIFHSRKKGKEQLVSLKSPSSGMRPVIFGPVVREVTEAIIGKVGPKVVEEVAEGLGLEVVKKEVIAIQRKEKID